MPAVERVLLLELTLWRHQARRWSLHIAEAVVLFIAEDELIVHPGLHVCSTPTQGPHHRLLIVVVAQVVPALDYPQFGAENRRFAVVQSRTEQHATYGSRLADEGVALAGKRVTSSANVGRDFIAHRRAEDPGHGGDSRAVRQVSSGGDVGNGKEFLLVALGLGEVVVTRRINVPVHVPTRGTGELGITPVVHFEGETEGGFARRRTWQRRDTWHHGALQLLVDEKMQATPFQPLVGETNHWEIAQTVLTLIVCRAIIARVSGVKKA